MSFSQLNSAQCLSSLRGSWLQIERPKTVYYLGEEILKYVECKPYFSSLFHPAHSRPQCVRHCREDTLRVVCVCAGRRAQPEPGG